MRVAALCALGLVVLVSAVSLAFHLGTEQSKARVTASAQEVTSLQEQMALLTATVAQLDEAPRRWKKEDDDEEDSREIATRALARARRYGRSQKTFNERARHSPRLSLKERLKLDLIMEETSCRI